MLVLVLWDGEARWEEGMTVYRAVSSWVMRSLILRREGLAAGGGGITRQPAALHCWIITLMSLEGTVMDWLEQVSREGLVRCGWEVCVGGAVAVEVFC